MQMTAVQHAEKHLWASSRSSRDWFLFLTPWWGFKNMRAKEVNMLFCKFPNDWVAVVSRTLGWENKKNQLWQWFLSHVTKNKNVDNNSDDNRLWGQNLEWDLALVRFTYAACAYLSATHETEERVRLRVSRGLLASPRLVLHCLKGSDSHSFEFDRQVRVVSADATCPRANGGKKEKKCSSSDWNT